MRCSCATRASCGPAIVMGCSVGGLYTLATILPFVLIDAVGLTPTEFGVGMLAQSGSFMLGSLVMRRLLHSVEAHRLVPLGLALHLRRRAAPAGPAGAGRAELPDRHGADRRASPSASPSSCRPC